MSWLEQANCCFKACGIEVRVICIKPLTITAPVISNNVVDLLCYAQYDIIALLPRSHLAITWYCINTFI
ncbi:MAG: hypothetical protein J5767_12515 [Paludibacteraceae bacterium]|nr:hypothetical protein [Paludibacteraceae bacterium]